MREMLPFSCRNGIFRSMRSVRQQIEAPTWQPPAVHVGRRRALIGLSGLVMAAMHVKSAWAQAPGSCLLTPEAGEGPFYIDPKLVRSDFERRTARRAVGAVDAGRAGGRLREAHQGTRRRLARRCHRALLRLCAAGRRRRCAHRCCGWQELSARNPVHRRGWQRALSHDLPELVRRSHSARTLQGLPWRQRGDREPIFFPDEVNDEVFKQWEPYRQHVSKRQTFNHNDPIRAGVHSSVTRAGRLFAAKATLVVAPESPRRDRAR